MRSRRAGSPGRPFRQGHAEPLPARRRPCGLHRSQTGETLQISNLPFFPGTIRERVRFLRHKGRQPLKEKMMNKVLSGLLATTLSASFAVAAAMPVEAAPAYVPQPASVSSDVQTVQYRPWERRRNFRGEFRGNRNFYRDNRGAYWNGHRGYREYRPGYRRHGDFWFPLAAFATGALITGAIANNRNRVYEGNSHVQWCYDRYRSYRASDNTFQPYNGPRQQCISPY
ncbi:BA14K family protein [Mesorhizobium sp. B1-1-1]|nr:BA14K family protein [Mesorhizobium sp. B1-1-1]